MELKRFGTVRPFVTNCHLTRSHERAECLPLSGFETIRVSNGFGVVLRRSYFWRQAQVCMSLARVSDDPVLKQHYEELALEFAQNAGDERDHDITAPSLADPKPDSGNTNPHK